MKFYQTIRFQVLTGLFLIVVVVAAYLTWDLQDRSRTALRAHEFDLFDKS